MSPPAAPDGDGAPRAAEEPLRPDEEELCICFHVPLRKVVKFIRLQRPRVASQCSECYGAGTGCGWCIPFIEQVFERMAAGEEDPRPAMDPEEYRARRREHIARTRQGKPGAG